MKTKNRFQENLESCIGLRCTFTLKNGDEITALVKSVRPSWGDNIYFIVEDEDALVAEGAQRPYSLIKTREIVRMTWTPPKAEEML